MQIGVPRKDPIIEATNQPTIDRERRVYREIINEIGAHQPAAAAQTFSRFTIIGLLRTFRVILPPTVAIMADNKRSTVCAMYNIYR